MDRITVTAATIVAANVTYLLYNDHLIIRKQAEMLDNNERHIEFLRKIKDVQDDILLRPGSQMTALDAAILENLITEYKVKANL